MTTEDRELLSHRLIDFADRHCSLEEAAILEEEHAASFPSHKVEAGSKKRPAGGSADEPASKKTAVEGVQRAAPASASQAPSQGALPAYTPIPSIPSAGTQLLPVLSCQ